MFIRCVSRLCVLAVLMVATPGILLAQQDNWLGGAGGWSYGYNWSLGSPPVAGDIVSIDSGSFDSVTLDTSPPMINSLTLGTKCCYSYLTDNGAIRTLNVTSNLHVGQYGHMYLYGTTVTAGSLTNDSQVYISNNASLQLGSLTNNSFFLLNSGTSATLNSQPGGGISDVALGADYEIFGTFKAGAVSAFNNLNSVEGTLVLFNGQSTVATPGNGPLAVSSSGIVAVESLQVVGDVSNSGIFATSYYGGGNGALTVNNTLTNNVGGTFGPYGNLDVASVGALNNSGTVHVGTGATLNLTNQPAGITDVVAGSSFDLAGTFNAGANNGFYQLANVDGTLILENGQTTTTTPSSGTFTVGSAGYVEVKSGTTFNIIGSVIANGILSFNDPLPTTVNITGMLTNLGGQVNVVGPTAFLSVGGIGNGGMLTLPEGSTVSVANGFYQLANGTLGETIGANGFAIISVNGGLVMLDGTLDVLLDPGYNPAVGSTYEFLLFSPGALSGTFASIQNDIFNGGTEKWVVVYNDAGGYVELVAASAAPEPGTFLLLGSGLLGLAYSGRRRWRR